MGVERMHSPKYWFMRVEEFHTRPTTASTHRPKTRFGKLRRYEDLAGQAQQILDAEQPSEHRPSGAHALALEQVCTLALS